MRKHLLGLMLIAGLAGCSSESDVGSADGLTKSVGSESVRALSSASLAAQRESATSFASLPDRGELLAYGGARKVRESGAYTWHPVSISEEHALNAIGTGRMVVNTPTGEALALQYERHEEQPDGNWTWIGRTADGGNAVLTFGQKAVFGTIARGNQLYRVRTDRSGAWVVETDASLVSGNGQPSSGTDMLIPPEGRELVAAATRQMEAQASSTKAGGGAVIDLLLGYSSTIATELGSHAAAVTLMSNLTAAANAAYTSSGVTRRLRLVHAMPVDYADATSNAEALRQLTGYNDATRQPITPNAAFNLLRASRDQFGADLVAFVRRYRAPEQDGCGIAWLLGKDNSAISVADEAFGYAVVSDGVDLNERDNNTYFCSNLSLAHELGHLMGQAHNQANATAAGAHPYSYGYRESAPFGFYTVMAYPAHDSQIEAPVFASPLVQYAGRPAGTATEDNVRSMNETMLSIAGFRSTVVPLEGQLNLYSIFKAGASGRTELFTLTSELSQIGYAVATGLGATGSDRVWSFQFGDFNGDGHADAYAILKRGDSGRTEVHVLDGSNNYQSFLFHGASALGWTGSDNRWVIKLGDYNRDGRLDLYAIERQGASGRTEVHVLNGADGYRSFVAHIATALGTTGTDYSWDFAVADMNGDGRQDLYVVAKDGGSGRTEVHVLDGATSFQSYLLHAATILPSVGDNNTWNFKVGDYNLDGKPDLYAINKMGASGRTEVSVMNGADYFQTYLLAQVPSVLLHTGGDSVWEFELAPAR